MAYVDLDGSSNSAKSGSGSQLMNDDEGINLENLLSGIAEGKQGGVKKLNIKAVKSVIHLHSRDLTNANEQYLKLQEKLEEEQKIQRMSPESLMRAIHVLEDRKDMMHTRTSKIKLENEESKIYERFNSFNGMVEKLNGELAVLEKEKSDIELLEGDHKRLRIFQSLIAKNEALKKKESDFKKMCKGKHEKMMQQNNAVQREMEHIKDNIGKMTKPQLQRGEQDKTKANENECIGRLHEELVHKV